MGRPVSNRVCDVEGCDRKHCAQGLCRPHYKRLKRTGQTDPIPRARPLADRFWQYVDKNGPMPAVRPDLGPCWLWTGNADDAGYGRLNVGGRVRPAHRLVFEVVGESAVAPDLTVDHLCMTHGCVRPKHLEIVTLAENIQRAAAHYAGKRPLSTHCREGHPKAGANAMTRSDGGVLCRICRLLAEHRAHIARGLNCHCNEKACALAATLHNAGHVYRGDTADDRGTENLEGIVQ